MLGTYYMAPISKHVQLWGMGIHPTSTFLIPCWTHCSGFSNDHFAPGPSFRRAILAAKEVLLNFKSDHVILLHKTHEGSQQSLWDQTPFSEVTSLSLLWPHLCHRPTHFSVIFLCSCSWVWPGIPPPLIFMDPKLVHILHNCCMCHFWNFVNSYSKNWILHPLGLEWPGLFIDLSSHDYRSPLKILCPCHCVPVVKQCLAQNILTRPDLQSIFLTSVLIKAGLMVPCWSCVSDKLPGYVVSWGNSDSWLE